jgi:zinc transporter, ZIP family
LNLPYVAGFLASVIGMMFGGSIAWFFRDKGISTIFSICTGLIFGLVILEILPEGIEIGGWMTVVFGLIFGYLIFSYLEKGAHSITIITNDPKKDVLIHSGALLIISISIHNFPIGIALGANSDASVTNSMMTAIMFHNIPEGIAVFTPLFMAGFGIMTLLIGALIASLPIGVGALIGYKFGMGIPWLLALIISFAMGIILSVAVKEMFGIALKSATTMYCSTLATVGFVFITLYLYFL